MLGSTTELHPAPAPPFLRLAQCLSPHSLSITFLVLALTVWDYSFPIGSWCLEFEDSTGMYILHLSSTETM